MLELKRMPYKLTVCKVADLAALDLSKRFFFIGKTDEEISVVCETADTPISTTERDDGWRCFRIQGVLDFSLVGILSKISGILAAHQISIFAVSTFNTDYILVKEKNYASALDILVAKGYKLT